MKTRTNSPQAIAAFDDLPPSASVRLPTVCALYACSPATVWRWAADGTIPAPRHYGHRITAWSVGELRADLANKRRA